MPKNKIKVHIIHHTHWDMEWYFTKNDTSALFNYDLQFLFNQLSKPQSGSFLFDGQTAIFEEIIKNPILFKKLKKFINNNKLKVGPWYSQVDMRLTSDEGILRNYHYGQNIHKIKTNTYNYIYNPDTFGFSENIPILGNLLNKKYIILWRGVNRQAINDSPIFKWKAQNGENIIVYNIVSGYFIGRYLYDDQKLDSLYKNNILPSIKTQSYNGKYSVVALPSGGDQQPYNNNLQQAIKKLNEKNDGCEYILSTWNNFLEELKPQIQDIPIYKGSLTTAFGGRVHKTIGSHRSDIKKLIFKGELLASRVLEPMLLMSDLGKKMYPKTDLDQMWKKILLSQAHDAYAGCNSDQVNKEIKDRLLISHNIYQANKDLIIRFMSRFYDDNSLMIINPTLFKGSNLFNATIATKDKKFSVLDKNNNSIPYLTLEQKKIKGGLNVIYTANGEKEIQKPDYYVSKISLLVNVEQQNIEELTIKNIFKKETFKTNFDLTFKNNKIVITKNKQQVLMDLHFKMDAGDSYDLDLYDEVKNFSLKNTKLIKSSFKFQNGIKHHKFIFTIKLPQSIKDWKNNICKKIMKLQINVILANKVKINYQFNNVSQNLLVQSSFQTNYESSEHILLSHAGFIKRKNKINLKKFENLQLREKISNFDIMHGNIIVGNEKNNLSISSLDIREYLINNNLIYLNIFRTPDILGRNNLRIRPGRASGLPDKIVYIPNSINAINEEIFSLEIDFDQTLEQRAHIIDKLLIEDLTRHNQKLFRYISRIETWTLPPLLANKNFTSKIIISNPKLILLAYFKNNDEYIIRINNPMPKLEKSHIKIVEKTIKNVIFNANEIKEWKIKK